MDHYILISAYPHSSQGWNHWSGESFSWMLEWCLHGNKKWKDFWMQTFISMELLFAGRLNVWEDFFEVVLSCWFHVFPPQCSFLLTCFEISLLFPEIFFSFLKTLKKSRPYNFPNLSCFWLKDRLWKSATGSWGGGKTPRLPMYRWGCNFSFRSLKSRFTQWCGIAVWILNLQVELTWWINLMVVLLHFFSW